MYNYSTTLIVIVSQHSKEDKAELSFLSRAQDNKARQ